MAVAPETSSLDTKYNVLRLGVISSNSVASRTGLLIKHLSQQSSEGKKAIASLQAKAPVANKLVSAIEIAKRELSRDGRKIFQYSALTSETVIVKARAAHQTHGKQLGNTNAADDAEEDEEEEAFEVMAEKDKIQEMPVLTIYLSLSSIKELRDAHGYAESL